MKSSFLKVQALKWLIVSLLFTHNVSAQTLSPQSSISLLTVDSGNEELYTVFGHSVLRVQDPANGIDWVYNYGVFDFRTPNFYMKFTRGQLPYQLVAYDYFLQLEEWKTENRLVIEQKLNLTQKQKQTIFEFLQRNYLPENRAYYYKFFYDNCSTRIRDVVVNTLKDSLQLSKTLHADSTYRQWIDKYSAERKPWGAFGMDLGLGLPSDEKTGAMGAMFLPKNMSDAFDAAKVLRDGKWQALVKEKHPVNAQFVQNQVVEKPLFTPKNIFLLLTVLVLLFTFWQYKNQKNGFLFDKVLFSIIGLAGWFLLILWFFTDHGVTAKNINILWALPLMFPLALFLGKKAPNWLKINFLIYSFIVLLFIIFGVVSGINSIVLIINLMLLTRSIFVLKRL